MQAVLTPLLWLAVATIVLSAFAALAQRDLKRILAYSSINHLGYCLLGVFAAASATGSALDRTAALNGVVLQMFNHGITASLLFCFVAFLEDRSNGARGLEDFGGLRKVAPIFCGLMGLALFSSLGFRYLTAEFAPSAKDIATDYAVAADLSAVDALIVAVRASGTMSLALVTEGAPVLLSPKFPTDQPFVVPA